MEKKDNLNELHDFRVNEAVYQTKLTKKFLNRKPWVKPNEKEIHSVIPGTVLNFMVKEGDTVEEGQELLLLEAMKMENRIKAPVAGKVKGIHVKVGERIPKGTLMIEIE